MVSTLIPPEIWKTNGEPIILDYYLEPVWIFPELVILPTVILLWAGIALFIGAFAQLLWHPGRATEPL
jgi:hypothetical protein